MSKKCLLVKVYVIHLNQSFSLFRLVIMSLARFPNCLPMCFRSDWRPMQSIIDFKAEQLESSYTALIANSY